MVGKLQAWAAIAGATILAVVAIFFGGKRVAFNEIKLERAKATARSIQERAKTNAEVSQDSDLLNRARNVGVVRKP
jgi:hypothetical protein